MRRFWKSELKEQKGEKLESVDAIEHRGPAIERPRQGSNAPVFTRGRRRLIVVRSSAPMHEAHSSRSPVLEVFGF
jgi:hypothetical protein